MKIALYHPWIYLKSGLERTILEIARRSLDPTPDAPVEYWNKTWLQYSGQTLEEAMGRAWNGGYTEPCL